MFGTRTTGEFYTKLNTNQDFYEIPLDTGRKLVRIFRRWSNVDRVSLGTLWEV